MVYKKFRFWLVARIALLIITIFLIFVSIQTKLIIAPILAVIFLIFQVFSLFHFLDKTNRDLASFLESIRYSEFSRTFKPEGIGVSFDELSKAFNNVIGDFQKVRSEKEEHFHYLQSVLQNIDISIIAYMPDGTVDLINKSAKKLFQVNSLTNIEALKPVSEDLVTTLKNIRPGKSYLVKVQEEDDILQLSISATELKIKDKPIIIASISNIQNVLEEQETEAWQKLIRVLTHEIMNSITPIASLSETLQVIIKDDNSISKNTEEITQALNTINKRSNGLLHFVNTYRNLTRIPKPNFRITYIKDMMNNIRLLVEDELKKFNIEYNVDINPENIEVFADDQLIEQVIINLIKNSVNALENKSNAFIRVKAFYNKRGRVTIQVIDNGKGILKDVIDKIFIPFFTTKPNGSGIGLSLSKQILRLHNASITAHSVPESETVFTITF
jgi:nitrogen fixation/metabolism regulation signal transduction histidine kinase